MLDTIFILAGIAGTSFTLALSGALMPGPLLTVTMAEAARRGTIAGPLVITGHAILELLLVLAIIKGLGVYLNNPTVIGAISLLGGIILFLMGIDMIRKAASMYLGGTVSAGENKSAGNPILMGFMGSLANPYWIIWWVTIGLGYLSTAGHFGAAGIIAFFLGHIAADYGWYIMVAMGISRGKNIASDRIYQNMIRCCGLFLIGFGGWFLTLAYGNFAGA